MTLRDEHRGFVTGKILVAMPALMDDRFDHAVVYVCAHSAEGAMGLILNRRLDVLSFPDLLEQLNIAPSPKCQEIEVHFGGPVDEGRGFVLHSADYRLPTSMVVNDAFTLTANVDVLRAIAQDEGPREFLMALGYAGWSAHQLEEEIRANLWLAVPADPALVFSTRDEDMWATALRRLGIEPSMLASEGGRA